MTIPCPFQVNIFWSLCLEWPLGKELGVAGKGARPGLTWSLGWKVKPHGSNSLRTEGNHYKQAKIGKGRWPWDIGSGAWRGVHGDGWLVWGCGKTQKHSEWRDPAEGQSHLRAPPSAKSLASTLFPHPREVTTARLWHSVYLCAFGGCACLLSKTWWENYSR